MSEKARLDSSDKAYTVKQVAEIFSVTTYAVYSWIHRGLLKGFKAGFRWRVLKSDLDDFIASRTPRGEESPELPQTESADA